MGAVSDVELAFVPHNGDYLNCSIVVCSQRSRFSARKRPPNPTEGAERKFGPFLSPQRDDLVRRRLVPQLCRMSPVMGTIGNPGLAYADFVNFCCDASAAPESKSKCVGAGCKSGPLSFPFEREQPLALPPPIRHMPEPQPSTCNLQLGPDPGSLRGLCRLRCQHQRRRRPQKG